jgi:hypothetical protein
MLNLVRFIVVAVVIVVAVLLALGVTGLLTASEIWNNSLKVLALAGIVLVASIIILFVTKSK